MKNIYKKIFFMMLAAATVLNFPPSARAETYTIDITEPSAVVNPALTLDFQYMGANDVFVQAVDVINHTADAYAFYLKEVEILGDSILLDQLTFTFAGDDGKSLTLTKADFSGTNWPTFFTITQNTNGSFTMKTTAGNLTNEYQGLSCRVRYTFEMVQLAVDPDSRPGQPGKTGDDPGVLLLPLCGAGFGLLTTILLIAKINKRDEGLQEDEKICR